MTQPDPTRPDAAQPAAVPADPAQAQAAQTAAPARPERRPERRSAPPLPAGPDARPGVTLLKLTLGAACLLALAYFQWTPGEWPVRLLTWVLLTLLADEFGGWFGYAGLLLGGVGYLSPVEPPAEWLIILPLVGGTLMGTLLLKHSGGLFVLPFAGVLFAAVLIGVGRFGTVLDPQMTLPGNPEFQRNAIMAMLIALSVSAVRQLTELILRRRRMRAPTATIG
ncbi:hypothetical protein IHN63_03940 [Deinococcus sp. 6YEL10]|uniref:hypothetical protein n=3 Tax=unclassified Deinococcus TaxID=2623546 RepID=UPI001E498C62|nr:hypothetical protein [Deinococcus sp. 6YEL10]MCD0160454.1 hypothetical protein [Deinococcus sp. 6YEL10]